MNKGLQFTAVDDTGHRVVVDTDTEYGGLDQGIRPIEFLLVSLGGCMGMDIVGILQKKGGKINRFEIVLDGKRAADHPRRYEKIFVKIICEGDYRQEDLARSLELSRDKYCGAFATLQNPPEIEFSL
ncbi:MAG: OsmC family protein [candidate division WOR-3 bacterium]|nr:MAG: OsmC family protein [candidate division WOR-3 bacterium]